MLFGQGYSRRQLSWFDRYAVWAIESFRGAAALLPPTLLVGGAIWLWEVTNRSATGTALLWGSVVIAVLFVGLVFGRGIRVWRGEMRHWKHADAFWERKGAEGFTASQWLLMSLQLALLVAGLAAIGYFVS